MAPPVTSLALCLSPEGRVTTARPSAPAALTASTVAGERSKPSGSGSGIAPHRSNEIATATAAIKDQQYYGQIIEKVKKDREILTDQLRGLDFDVPASFANFVLAESKKCKAGLIYDKLVERSIYVRYFDVPGLDNKLRITVGTSEQNGKLVSALKEILSG